MPAVSIYDDGIFQFFIKYLFWTNNLVLIFLANILNINNYNKK